LDYFIAFLLNKFKMYSKRQLEGSYGCMLVDLTTTKNKTQPSE